MAEQSLVSRAHLRVVRRLPVFGDVLVASGEPVEPWTLLARARQMPGDPYVVDLAPAGRPLPPPEVLERGLHVALGDTVAQDDVLCRLPGEDVRAPVAGRVELISLMRGRILLREDPRSAQPVVVIDAARQLDIWRAMLPMYMVRRVGEQVPRGGVIAAAPGSRGSLRHVLAPAAGTIERIDPSTGYVYLVRPVHSSEVRAFLRGRVAEVLPSEGAVVEGEATVLQGVYGAGGERWGELLALGEGDLLRERRRRAGGGPRPRARVGDRQRRSAVRPGADRRVRQHPDAPGGLGPAPGTERAHGVGVRRHADPQRRAAAAGDRVCAGGAGRSRRGSRGRWAGARAAGAAPRARRHAGGRG
jgi:hypothetical protein